MGEVASISSNHLKSVKKLPEIGTSLKAALEHVKCEEKFHQNLIIDNVCVSNSDIEIVFCLQEDHQQRCRLYMAHKVMATDLQNSYHDLPKFDPKNNKIQKRDHEALRTSTPIRDTSYLLSSDNCSNKSNSVVETVSAANNVDKEVENILSHDHLMDKTWNECSVENKKERIIRLHNIFTPSITRQGCFDEKTGAASNAKSMKMFS